jgi:hypothetical protein
MGRPTMKQREEQLMPTSGSDAAFEATTQFEGWVRDPSAAVAHANARPIRIFCTSLVPS